MSAIQVAWISSLVCGISSPSAIDISAMRAALRDCSDTILDPCLGGAPVPRVPLLRACCCGVNVRVSLASTPRTALPGASRRTFVSVAMVSSQAATCDGLCPHGTCAVIILRSISLIFMSTQAILSSDPVALMLLMSLFRSTMATLRAFAAGFHAISVPCFISTRRICVCLFVGHAISCRSIASHRGCFAVTSEIHVCSGAALSDRSLTFHDKIVRFTALLVAVVRDVVLLDSMPPVSLLHPSC